MGRLICINIRFRNEDIYTLIKSNRINGAITYAVRIMHEDLENMLRSNNIIRQLKGKLVNDLPGDSPQGKLKQAIINALESYLKNLQSARPAFG